MEYKDYLAAFEQKLQNELLKLCTTCKMLDGTLLATDDIDEHWKKLGPEYLADAVGQVAVPYRFGGVGGLSGHGHCLWLGC